MPNPEVNPIICSEITCWAWNDIDTWKEPRKECLHCKHNISALYDRPVKDEFMTKRQKWGY